ncbi:hypothetical protein ORM66_00495 [Bacillus cereus]|uniref:hypothetical protein n=1 Tax=Bacillus cereus TaxID=1396 RepID=UPI002AC0F1C5|nr:hypothetical protein [Bacillus cereus]MDZ4610965.1 hypothetical protein [Bacillus cereus]
MEISNKDKTCFIITPIGEDQSDIRRASEGVIDAVIIPSLEEMGFESENIQVAHRMANPGSINKQVITSVLECDLAIANLTNLNPNVMYELAIRHAARKPVIQICQKGTRLPFDITDERTLFYSNDMAGVIELQNAFSEMVDEALGDESPDNPIYRVMESNSIMKKAEAIDDPSRFLLNRMDNLESTFSEFMNTVLNNTQGKQSGLKNLNEYNGSQSFKVTYSDLEKIKPEIDNLIKEINHSNNGVNCIMVAGKNAQEAKIIVDSDSKKDIDFVREKFIELRDSMRLNKIL